MSIFFKSSQPVLSQVEFETAILEKLKHIARITTVFTQAPRQNELEYLTWVSSQIKLLESQFYETHTTFKPFRDVKIAIR